MEAEAEIINEMKTLGKPFVIILNTTKPAAKETLELANEMSNEYQVRAIPVNCDQLRKKDILDILKEILLEFPINQVNFYIPKWAETLELNHPIKDALLCYVKQVMDNLVCMNHVYQIEKPENEYISEVTISNLNLKDGSVNISIQIPETFYYEMLSELLGSKVENEYDFLTIIKDVAKKRRE